MKYKSELIKEIVDKRGHKFPSLHYQSECVESWIEEAKGAYPKLCDYESEWLNYIVENPNGEFPYVTISDVTEATINNVVPYEYKSAILSGNTLINSNNGVNSTKFYINSKSDFNRSERLIRKTDKTLIKPSTRYLLTFKVSELNLDGLSQVILYINNDTTDLLFPNAKDFVITANGSYKQIVTTNVANNFNNHTFVIKGKASEWEQTDSTSRTLTISDIMLIEYQEGMENWDIPYFEGMKSVKMPVLTTVGKNLWDGNYEVGDINTSTGNNTVWNDAIRSDFIEISPLQNYVCSNNMVLRNTNIFFYDSNKKFIKHFFGSQFTSPLNAKYIRWSGGFTDRDLFQIEVGSHPTSYEPYKSNILNTSEDVELRGIGEVKDTLDCLTGEKVERIGETTFNGSDDEDWEMLSISPWTENGYYTFECTIQTSGLPTYDDNGIYAICDKFNSITYNVSKTNVIGILLFNARGKKVGIKQKECTTLDEWKQYLSQNPITVQYQLATPVVKTVDLNVEDQDGNTLSKIKPIEGTMHISTDGNPIKPTFTGEIPVEAISQNLSSFIEE